MVAILQMPKSLDDPGAERRLFPRKQVEAEVLSLRVDHSLQALRRPRLNLRLRDLSMGGLSAIADQPLEAGERLSVTFPTLEKHPGWDVLGRVLRCEPSALGYRVAVAFDPLPAA
jgi:hypothetical protein